jgi:hypothetical protein
VPFSVIFAVRPAVVRAIEILRADVPVASWAPAASSRRHEPADRLRVVATGSLVLPSTWTSTDVHGLFAVLTVAPG